MTSTFLTGRSVLVTGAGGFIGPYVVDELLRNGARIRAIVAAPGQRAQALPDEVETLIVDVTDRLAFREALSGADIVVHMAGGASVADSLKHPAETYAAHVEGTLNALDASRRERVRRFVYVSSAEVYGRPQSSPVAEEHSLRPLSPYGLAKAASESGVRAFSACYGIPAVVLRPFSVYGPGASPASLVGYITRSLRSMESIIVADLRPVRDYVYVADLASAVASACTADVVGCAVANVGSGRGTSVADVARLASALSSYHPAIVEDPTRRRPEHSEILELVADTSAALRLLGWTASTTLDRGIALTLDGDGRAPRAGGRR